MRGPRTSLRASSLLRTRIEKRGRARSRSREVHTDGFGAGTRQQQHKKKFSKRGRVGGSSTPMLQEGPRFDRLSNAPCRCSMARAVVLSTNFLVVFTVTIYQSMRSTRTRDGEKVSGWGRKDGPGMVDFRSQSSGTACFKRPRAARRPLGFISPTVSGAAFWSPASSFASSFAAASYEGSGMLRGTRGGEKNQGW